jgi:hypothetical protein
MLLTELSTDPSAGVLETIAGAVLSTGTFVVSTFVVLPNWSATTARTSYGPSAREAVSNVALNAGPVDEEAIWVHDPAPAGEIKYVTWMASAEAVTLSEAALPASTAGTLSVADGGVESTVTVRTAVV